MTYLELYEDALRKLYNSLITLGEFEMMVKPLDREIEVESDAEWIPVKTRPMDEEERREWSEKFGYDIEYDETVIYTPPLPDDGQEVLTCNRYGNITIDTFENDPENGCYFEENGDMDGIVAWMPLPKPYREDDKEYELATEQMEHDAMYEPTYNPEDGSM